MKLFIKHMVSIKCKMIVKAELDNLGLHYSRVNIGDVEVKENISIQQRTALNAALLKRGFVLQDDKKSILIKKINSAIIEIVHSADEMPNMNLSDYLSKKLNYDYTYLASQFSDITGTTIEQFVIAQKIERVKQLLIYNNYTLTHISYKMNYSSVAHLSNQFKKVTGLTPSAFKKLKHKRGIKP